MKKAIRILAMFMCAIMLSTFVPIFSQAESEEFPLEYETQSYRDENGEWVDGVIITGCKKDFIGEYRIPDLIDGNFVIGIGYAAFENCKKITKLIVPESVKEIDSYAFDGCTALNYLEFPADAYLGYNVFSGVPYASKITFEYNTVIYEREADNSTTSLLIGKKANLNNADFDTIIGKIDKIEIDPENKDFKLVDGVLYDSKIERLIAYPTASDAYEYTMPDSVVMYDFISENASLAYADNINFLNIGKNLISGELDALGITYDEFISGFINDQISEESAYLELALTYTYFLNPIFSPNLIAVNVSDENAFFNSIEGSLFDESGKILIKKPALNENKTFTTPEYFYITALSGCEDLEVTVTDLFSKNLYKAIVDSNPRDVKSEYYSLINALFSFSTAKSFTASETNKYLSTNDGVLYNKEQSVLIKYPITRRDFFLELPETVDAYATFVEAMDNSIISPFAPAFSSVLFDIFSFDYTDYNIFLDNYRIPQYLTLHLSDEQAKDLINEDNIFTLFGIPNICVGTFTEEIKATLKNFDEELEFLENEWNDLVDAYKNGEISDEEFAVAEAEYKFALSMVPNFIECNSDHQKYEVYDSGEYIDAEDMGVDYKSTGKIAVNVTDDVKVIYTSSDDSIVSVDSDGNYTVHSTGTVTITATIDGTDFSDSVEINAQYAWWQWIINILLLGFLWY